FLALTMLLTAQTTQAAGSSPEARTVVLALVPPPSVQTTANLEAEMIRGLTTAGLHVVRAEESDGLVACATPDCWRTARAKRRAAFVVRATVEATVAPRGKNGAKLADYSLALEAFDAVTGEPAIAKRQASCPQCRASEVDETAYLLAFELRRG